MRATVAIAAAPLVVAALLRGLHVGMAPEARTTAETLVFVALPGGWGLLRYPTRELGSRIALSAGKAAKPGPRPAWDEVPAPETKEKVRAPEESNELQKDRVERRAIWLKTLRGKFVPVGPKPWDPHRFVKVCIQSRLKSNQASNTKIINQVVEELRRVSGIHPWVVKAKHNVAAFGWRKGANCGVAVTLKGQRMLDFLARLNTIILPRVRDFEGLIPNSFDKYGNFWMGFDNQEPFKELDALIDNRELVHGFDIGIINNCYTQYDGLALMKKYGFPFQSDPRPRKIKIDRSLVPVKVEDKAKPKAKAKAKGKR